MLLTIKQPALRGYKSFHDYSPPTPPTTSRFPPAVTTGLSFPSLSASEKSLPPLPQTSSTEDLSMSTPHRGLPPPAAMAMGQSAQHAPAVGQHPPLSQPMGQLPAPPQQWQGAEESMRNWLVAKAEEDKRKQEEEKTRQETLRLEQRKIEQDMLRTSLTGGIPPYMVPMVFAGMGGGNLPNASLEWAQHYMAQAHHLQQQQSQQQQLLPAQSGTSPEQLPRRDSRVAAQSFGSSQQPGAMTLSSAAMVPPGSQTFPLSPGSRARQSLPSHSSFTRQPLTPQLPRLNTGEIHVQPPAAGPTMQIIPGQMPPSIPQAQAGQQQETQSSPSIYFHHWQPPTSQADHTTSPRKRKAMGPHNPAPPPTSQPQYTSPPFSQAGSSISNTPSSRRRGHSRQRSDGRGHRQIGGGYGQSMASPTQGGGSERHRASTVSGEARRTSGGSNPVSALLEQNETRPRSQSQSQQRHLQRTYSERNTPEVDEPRRRKQQRDDMRE